jgi:hypothetical protein
VSTGTKTGREVQGRCVNFAVGSRSKTGGSCKQLSVVREDEMVLRRAA